MDGKGGAAAAGWHYSARTAWVAPERDSLTADYDSLRMLSQDLLLPHSLLAIFSPNEESNPALASQNIDAGRNFSGR